MDGAGGGASFPELTATIVANVKIVSTNYVANYVANFAKHIESR